MNYVNNVLIIVNLACGMILELGLKRRLMKNRILVLLMIVVLPLFSHAQDSAPQSKTHKHKKTHKVAKAALPSWAPAHNYDATAHVYFPDYYTVYDPNRGGYVFWGNGQYVFTPSVPPFLEKVDLSKSRIQILKGISLDLHPELNYPYYMQQYPADNSGNTMVPVPVPGNPAGN